ncbi:MAG: S24 family peptidase [Tannerella sp.]|uniref:S24 family peptidase n=1 Tax=Tannerella sp. TaxID=2382127 RepID=UPI003FA207FA
MESFLQRIRQIIDSQKLSIRDFEKKIGAGQGVISKSLRQNTDITSKYLRSIVENFPQISSEWLLTGKGPMLKEQYNIDVPEVSTLNEESQITMYGRPYTERRYEIQSIPLYETEISAGLITLYSNQTEQTPIGNIVIPNAPKCDGAIPVRGDSMYPILKAGDIVCYKTINNLDNVSWGEIHNIYINADGDERFATKYLQKSEKGEEYVTLVSYNQHHQPQDVLKKHIKSIAVVKISIRYNSNI